jgi:dephospho-CoA kinase
VTGMSGVGKSTALAELARHGFDVVETDVPPSSEWSEAAGGYVWREKLVNEPLAGERRTTLFVSGAVSNQGRFYSQFDAVVLLSAPQDVLLRRTESRTTNEYGKWVEQSERIIRDMFEVEPLRRATSTHEIVTTKPIADVVAELLAIGRSKPPEKS